MSDEEKLFCSIQILAGRHLWLDELETKTLCAPKRIIHRFHYHALGCLLPNYITS